METEKLNTLGLKEIIEDWDEWIISPRARLSLVTDALVNAGFDYKSRLYFFIRSQVDYSGTAWQSLASLDSRLHGLVGQPIENRQKFVNQLASTFYSRLEKEGTENSKRLLKLTEDYINEYCERK
jgi:hypothetical protein